MLRRLLLAAALVVPAVLAPACGPPPAPTSQSLPGSAGAARQAAIFEDRAAALGLEFTHFNGMTGRLFLPEVFGAGVALFDADGDGDLDAYLVQGGYLEPGVGPSDALLPPPEGALGDRLFLNRLAETGELGFDDVTAQSGLDSTGYGMGVAVGDYDGDGALDLYVTNLGANRLWRNLGDGRFEDRTAEADADDPRWSVPAVFFDADGDGDHDLFVGNYVDFNLGSHMVCSSDAGVPDYCGPKSFRAEPDRLLRNRGDGRFEDVTLAAGLAGTAGTALGAISADLDGDGRLDLYVANDWLANYLWINLGDGRFEDRALIAAAALSGDGLAEASMGVDAGDYDGDGDLDLFLTHLEGETNTLYRNEGRARFVDASISSRLGMPSWPHTGFGTAFFDYDNDSHLDVLVVNGAIRRIETPSMAGVIYPLGQRNQLFRGTGTTFEETSAQAGESFAMLEVGRGAAFGDVDNDGDVDVLVSNNSGRARLLINTVGQDARWLGARLVRPGHADALGSRLRVLLANGSVIERTSRTAASYGSASDPRVVVGLGGRSAVEEVRIVWLGGAEESFGRLEARRYHELVEGDGKPVS